MDLIPRPGEQNSSQADPAFLRFEPPGLPSSRQVPVNEIWYYSLTATPLAAPPCCGEGRAPTHLACVSACHSVMVPGPCGCPKCLSRPPRQATRRLEGWLKILARHHRAIRSDSSSAT